MSICLVIYVEDIINNYQHGSWDKDRTLFDGHNPRMTHKHLWKRHRHTA
ncbi:hypothetical protein CsSME_00012945 [Camellia sinensis var. sinensis]